MNAPQRIKPNRSMSQRTASLLSWGVTLLVPLVLVLGAVRLLLTPAFLLVEYNTPGFPSDPYGFTKEERLHWSRIALDYLLNDADISFLGDLRFPEGQQAPPASCQFMDDCSRLYNQRELKHMVDVKNVVQTALSLWHFSLGGLLILDVWAWWGGWWDHFRRGLQRGGWLTAILVGTIVLLVVLAFGIIFVAFHNVFFEAGTWTFLTSDTLIRLFPERFWRDAFLAVGLLAGGVGALIGFLFRPIRQ
jgi:integral membrane protein (TIGR01906 family)